MPRHRAPQDSPLASLLFSLIVVLLTFVVPSTDARASSLLDVTASDDALLPPALQSGATADSAATDDAVTGTVDPRTTVPAVAANTPGVITGYVTDVESGKGLAYTNIVIYEVTPNGGRVQVGGSIAVTRGQYFARIAPGTYELGFLYLGYEPFTSELIELQPGQTYALDVQMKVKPIPMETFVVQATAIKNTAMSALVEKKKAVAVQEAITAEEISRGTDSDAAEALERVTGLSVVGGKFVFVRGLGDRYSSTSLNGAGLSSPEPNRRTVPLDIFPAAMLDNVVVQKTFTPDMDGEFGGGNIDIQTRDAIDEREFSQRISFGFSENVYANGFYGYNGGRTDWLGFDDGTRGLPRILDAYSDRPLPGKRNLLGEGLPVQQLSAIRESFSNVWTPRKQDALPNFGYSGLFADKYEVFGRQGSYLVAASLSNGFNTREFTETDRRGGNDALGIINARSEAEVQQSERSTLLGVTGAFNLRPTRGSRLSYNLLYTRGSDDKARIATGVNDQSETFLQNTLTYVERELASHVVSGQHVVDGRGSELQWMVNSSSATRNEPDRRFSEFKLTPFQVTDPNDSETVIDEFEGWGKSPLGFPFVRVFGESQESDLGLKLNYDFRLPETNWAQSGLKFGYSVRDRERSTKYRRFGIDCQNCEFDGSGEAEQAFDRSTYDNPSKLDNQIIRETTDSSDQYDAGQQVTGYYAMTDVYLARTLRLVGGARYETSEQFVVAESRNVAAADRERKETSLNNEDWLPALNLTWTATEKINVRAGYSKTLNRPEMRELSPFRNFNYENNVEEQGNLFVRQAEIDSYDFRFEVYPGMRRYLSFSLFRKNIDSPIERILFAQAAGSLKEVPGNGEEGMLQGWEVEWRGGLGELAREGQQAGLVAGWAATRPFWLLGQVPGLGALGALDVPLRRVGPTDLPALDRWGFTFNFSKIESDVTVNISRLTDEIRATTEGTALSETTQGDVVRQTGPLTGQSTYALNAGIIYSSERRDFSLMVKSFGQRLDSLGVGTTNLYERVPTVLDAAWATRIGQSLRLKLSVENILDQQREFFYESGGKTFRDIDGNLGDDSIRRSYHDGRNFGISLSYAL